MEKLAVCCINRKGGVGKTTASIIMAQTAAEHGMRVLCVDVDDQKNFFDAMQALVAERKLLAYHDRSDGGLITTLAEMGFGKGQI